MNSFLMINNPLYERPFTIIEILAITAFWCENYFVNAR